MSEAPGPLDERALQQFFEMSLDLLCIGGTDGRCGTLNPAWERVLGWSPAELAAEPLAGYVHPDDVERTVDELGRLGTETDTVAFVNRLRCRDGSYRDLEWSATAAGDDRFLAVVRDVTDHRRALDDAQRSDELWRAVLRTAVDPIVLIDGSGTVVAVNEATTRLFGYTETDLVGGNVSRLMPEPDRSRHDDYLRRYLDTGEARIIGIGREVVAQRADGTTFPVALAVSQVDGPDGPLFTGIVHDLSERVLAEQRLRAANEQLEARVAERTAELEASMAELARSNRDLEQFAYIASHDLQAPLRNVRQGLDLLDHHLTDSIGSGFDAEAEELRDLTLAAVTRMEDLIKGLLSFSRVQTRTGPPSGAVDLGSVAAEVVQELRFDLEATGATVTIGSLPTVRGDAAQLRQLLQNLVQNAVKYSDGERPPEIEIAAHPVEAAWAIAVRDNGIGVDTGQHERIFELFRRGHPGYDGVGIGLAVCQRIVERHGGEIWVDSEPGAGATFTFTLPDEAGDR